MASLVFIMASVFYTISHGYLRYLFQQYASAAQRTDGEEWARLLSYYYKSHGDSWNQADGYVQALLDVGRQALSTDHVENVVVLDAAKKKVVSADQGQNEADEQNGIDLDGVSDQELATGYPIMVDGHSVGTVYVSDTGTDSLHVVEERVLHSMAVVTVLGLLLTSIAALLIGVLWSRRLTEPLRTLLFAIEKIVRGDETVRVNLKSNDEFGVVGHAFNQMTERLLQTELARRHLVADVAHELRTPLTIMQGQLESIQQGVMKADETVLLSMLDEVMRLTRLVEDLRQLSLAEIGALPLEKDSTDVELLVSRIVDNFSIEAEERAISLTLQSKEGSTIAFVDGNRITQVFVNLLGNALRHTPDGGRISVFVQNIGEFIQITVEDTGIGIAKEHLPHIFDRFYRVNEDRSRETGGMGIGLAIAKEYVEAHNGTILVESQPDIGTKFTVNLPICEKN